MEIPPDQREAAREFVATAESIRSAERRMVRNDRVAFVTFFVAIAVNAVNATTGGFFNAVSLGVVVALSFVTGMNFVRVSDRREHFRQVDAMADETETALAFYDLDDA